jgi:hypothetical protein
VAAGPGGDKHLLGDILGLADFAQRSHCHREDQPGVAAIDLLQGTFFTGQKPVNYIVALVL